MVVLNTITAVLLFLSISFYSVDRSSFEALEKTAVITLGLSLLALVGSYMIEYPRLYEVPNTYRARLLLLAIVTGFLSITYFGNATLSRALERASHAGENAERDVRTRVEETYPTILVFVAVLWVSVLIFDGLGQWPIFHDEHHHVDVAMSLLDSGEFALYNYVTGEPSTPYTRGYFLNFYVAVAHYVFGQNEFAYRTLPAVAGILTIPITFMTVQRYLSQRVAALTAVGLSCNLLFVFFARFLRPYTIFVAVFLATLYTFDVAIEKFHEYRRDASRDRLRSVVSYTALTGILLLVALQASQFAKIILVLFPVSIAIHVSLRPDILDLVRDSSTTLLRLTPIVGIVVVVLWFTTSLSSTPRQLGEFFALSKLFNPTTEYIDYLFGKFVRFEPLYQFLAGIGGLALLYRGVCDKSPQELSFLMFAAVPTFLMIFLFDRYEDPRYILYLVPLTIAVAMVGLETVAETLVALTPVSRPSLAGTVLAIVVTFAAIFVPIVGGGGGGGLTDATVNAPGDWERTDGSQLVHRRLVPPAFQLTYGCLNQVVESGDRVIISGAVSSYLEPKSGIEYYLLPWDSKQIRNLRTNETVSYRTVLSAENNGSTYTLTTYSHLLDQDVLSHVVENTSSISSRLNATYYEYNAIYEAHELYWPALRTTGNATVSDECESW